MRANDGDRLATARMKRIEDPILRSLIPGIYVAVSSGTGKTHACLALGLAACQRGFSVTFATGAGLVHQLMEARDERRLLKLQAQLAAVKLLIVDEPASEEPAASDPETGEITPLPERRVRPGCELRPSPPGGPGA